MENETILAILVLIATAIGAAAAYSQARTVSNQHKLLEAETYSRQRTEWEGLSGDWQRCKLIAFGPDRARREGISSKDADELLDILDAYRQVDTKWLDISALGSIDDASWADFQDEVVQADELIHKYENSCRRVVLYLAQVSSLVLRKKISIEAVYSALGPDLIEIGSNIRALVSYRWGSKSACVAPQNEERSFRSGISLDELCMRMGWGEFLRESRGAAERVVLLQSLMIAEAYRVGDIDRENYYPEFGTIHSVIDLGVPAKMAIAWRCARGFGFLRAITLTSRLSRTSRKVQRIYPETFHKRTYKFVDKYLPEFHDEFSESRHRLLRLLSRMLCAFRDIFRVPNDCSHARVLARSGIDVREPKMPDSVSGLLEPDSPLFEVGSYWTTWAMLEYGTRG